LLRKLGLLSSENGQLRNADAYFTKALRLYKNNNVNDRHVVGVQRDKANNQGKIALTMSTAGLSEL